MIDNRALCTAFTFGQALVEGAKAGKTVGIKITYLSRLVKLLKIEPDYQLGCSPMVGIEFLGELGLPVVILVNE
ncbi:hypothetical protein GCM10011506_16670 [Marivirga lumbricoides]|uniref:Uncharacterized protein n=1 Tax=Marivirga lumbricoides TaxID=1046115 RepID=A0ABQ1M0W5_9BACT|nr:hypothetical protein GCM10011506_16670 [Marivirga lumbricoides]